MHGTFMCKIHDRKSAHPPFFRDYLQSYFTVDIFLEPKQNLERLPSGGQSKRGKKIYDLLVMKALRNPHL